MEKKYKVYMLTFPNKKKYIGVTQRELKKRFDYGCGYAYNKEMYKDIKKYGWDSIKKEIVYISNDIEKAYNKEIDYIAKYKTTKNGYNKSTGGKFSTKGIKRHHSEETRLKMSVAKKGKHLSPNTEFPAKRVLCVETDTIYNSMQEAERKTGINHSKISMVCSGKRKTAGKYHWEILGGNY